MFKIGGFPLKLPGNCIIFVSKGGPSHQPPGSAGGYVGNSVSVDYHCGLSTLFTLICFTVHALSPDMNEESSL